MDPTPKQLKAARTWLGWDLDRAASESGIHKQTISRAENGHQAPTIDTLRAIVQAYARHGLWLDHGHIRFDPEVKEDGSI